MLLNYSVSGSTRSDSQDNERIAKGESSIIPTTGQCYHAGTAILASKKSMKSGVYVNPKFRTASVCMEHCHVSVKDGLDNRQPYLSRHMRLPQYQKDVLGQTNMNTFLLAPLQHLSRYSRDLDMLKETTMQSLRRIFLYIYFLAGFLGPSTAFSTVPAIPSFPASNCDPIAPSLEKGPPIFSPTWPMLPSAVMLICQQETPPLKD
jgi:hypothetical protein